jgi:beta propeller repeat protein
MLFILMPSPSIAAEWLHIPLSYGSTSTQKVQVYGEEAVWQQSDGNDLEIYYFDGMRISQITNNSGDDENPQIYGNYIVWEGHDGNDKEIFYHNLLSSTT